MTTTTTMSSHQKGHMVVKSSALAPINNTLNSQLLIQDHLSAHYQMVDKAKAAIDSSKPKSLTVSQKLRDQRKKKLIKTNGAVSQLSNGLNTMYVHDPCLKNAGTLAALEYETEHEYYNNHEPQQEVVESDYYYYQQPTSYRPSNPTYSGDLLEKMSDRFTQPDKPFTPRTLNVQHESRLKQTQFYNRPPSSREQKKRTESHRKPSPEREYDDSNRRSDRRRAPPQQPVPLLPIKRDADYADWIAGHRSRKSRSPGSPHSVSITDNVQSNRYKSVIKHHTDINEEERKYLEFVEEVTNDILKRGIYSDKALQLVFENHIMRHRLELNETIMRKKLSELRVKLGLHFDS